MAFTDYFKSKNILSKLKLGLGIADAVVPKLVQEVDVVVYGNPNAKRKDLYWIAVSAAFGHIKNNIPGGLFLPRGCIILEYHSEQNVVRFYCRQLSNYVQAFSTIFVGKPPFDLFNGPKEQLTGGKWEWYAKIALGGVPTTPEDFGSTGWEDETILTKNPIYKDAFSTNLVSHNPSPWQDERSRGGLPIASMTTVIDPIEPGNTYSRPDLLLFQALKDPCTAETTLPSITFPGSSGSSGPPATPVFELPTE